MANCRLLLTVLFYAWKWEVVVSCLGSRVSPSDTTTTQRSTTASKELSSTLFSQNGYNNTALITAVTQTQTHTTSEDEYFVTDHSTTATTQTQTHKTHTSSQHGNFVTDQSIPPDFVRMPLSDATIALICVIAVVLFIIIVLIVTIIIRKRRTSLPVSNAGVESNQMTLFTCVFNPLIQRNHHVEPIYENTMNRKSLVQNEKPVYSNESIVGDVRA